MRGGKFRAWGICRLRGEAYNDRDLFPTEVQPRGREVKEKGLSRVNGILYVHSYSWGNLTWSLGRGGNGASFTALLDLVHKRHLGRKTTSWERWCFPKGGRESKKKGESAATRKA